MKVLLLNGSPHANGVNATALQEMISVFEKNGIEAEIVQKKQCKMKKVFK